MMLIGKDYLKCSGRKGVRILFGVPEGEYIARQFALIAAAMPEAECRFVGFSWSTGRILRKLGLEYAHLPVKCSSARAPEVIPPLIEFVTRGFVNDTVPLSARQTLGVLSDFIDREIESFAPDIVVYGPIDHAICYLIDQNANSRGIPTIGIQTSFVANHFIVQTQGVFWEEFLRTAEVPSQSGTQEMESELPYVASDVRNCSSGKWQVPFWIRGFERVLRVMVRGVTFDTVSSLLTSVESKLFPPKWFPSIETLKKTEDIVAGCVLIALHQPTQPWMNPTWLDLIKFALDATPEGVPIVIRPHPREESRRIPKDLEERLHARGVRISRISSGPNLPTLLKHCRALITLTSATGMEALLAGVPVFVLGQAFYARPGLANFVSLLDAQVVRDMIIHTVQFQPDFNAVTEFKQWLLNERMVIAPEYGLTSRNSMPHRIREMLLIGKDPTT